MKKIIGIGNALMDIMVPVDSYNIIDEIGLPHGGMVMIDREKYDFILDKIKNIDKVYIAGGSASNTIYGLAKLDVPCSFFGKVGDDELGKAYEQDLRNAGVKPNLIVSNENATGCAIAFVTPDGERTFATYLGAAAELNESNISEIQFKGYDIIHIEGYLLFNYNLVKKVMEIAKSLNMKISLDLAAHNFVEGNREIILDLLENYVDYCFANEEESMALTGMEPFDALEMLSKHCEYTIVKLGANGSLIKHNNSVYEVDIFPADTIIDTTGAGDLYASGFIYGIINDCLPIICGEYGSLLGSKVIEVYGARIHDWTKILINKK
ncbi:adenosine kinase [Bacteroidales bacterium OttesenSCG-928-K03]|nr:adenosine kinase [Odoribacter sp. OttesenSCG-928-L07]MDL2238810.1 adenosine kinase [Bacteroidales bacterium OttesenSCG-928-L14]MDL2240984.1 adenosine kinase [Bacteroidales bacterium OttesenSCG-928-K22]MDL2242189.1 adenosine kinase [Bacteroidales bacterium OttesenSCG-928-K03]